MVVNAAIKNLMQIGMSEYEARAYIALLSKNPATAYEIAMASAIPTSKIYGVMRRLMEKSMAEAVDVNNGKSRRYAPVEPNEFLDGFGSKVEGTLKALKSTLSIIGSDMDKARLHQIKDRESMMDKAQRMIKSAQKTVLLSLWAEEMKSLNPFIKDAIERGVKAAIVHFGEPSERITGLYQHPIEHTIYKEKGGRGLLISADSGEAMIGIISYHDATEAAFSANSGFIMLAEDYIKHDIYVMRILRRFDNQLRAAFGPNYEKLRDVYSHDI